MIQKYLLLSNAGWKNMKKAIVASTAAHFSMLLLSLVTTFAFWQILQSFMGNPMDWNSLWLVFGGGIVAAGIVFYMHIIEYKYTYTSGNKASSEKRIAIAEHLRQLPLHFFERKNLTELASTIMNDCAQLEMSFTSLIPSLIGNLISIVLSCIMLSFFQWQMALAIFITTPISFGIILLTTKLQKRFVTNYYDTSLEMDASMQEYLEGIKVTKAFGLAGASYQDLEKACLKMKRVNMRSELLSGSLISVSTIILRIGTPITIYVGVSLLSNGTLTPIYLLFFLLLSTRIYGNLAAPLSKWGDILYVGISLKRLAALYQEPTMHGDTNVEIDQYEIALSNVSFSYHEKEEVLHDVSFKIPQGKVTALVGPSGSGKSTIARLVARFWDASSGEIKIGQEPVKNIDPEHLLHWISYVFQDVVLFNDTLYNNIKIGKKEATEEEVYRAAKAANCESFITKLPNGYQTIIGENGSTLSGGERQRISIARAILKDAPIVILDEATAALDPENEVEIQQALSTLVQNKTTLVIAHRLRTITDSDHIVVLDNGKVVEQGTHEALVKHGGLYAKLYTIQQQNLGWGVQ